SVFFLDCSGAPRALHSFPTRRSSDLFADAGAALLSLHDSGRLGPRWAWVLAGEGPAASSLRRSLSPALRPHVHLVGRVDERLLQDRKSTRLNSSHVAISYAVLCLKKK